VIRHAFPRPITHWKAVDLNQDIARQDSSLNNPPSLPSSEFEDSTRHDSENFSHKWLGRCRDIYFPVRNKVRNSGDFERYSLKSTFNPPSWRHSTLNVTRADATHRAATRKSRTLARCSPRFSFGGIYLR